MTETLPPLPYIPVGEYEHYKGKRYRVLSIARHSETLEPMVVYQALYGERGIWVRPASLFTETIQRDGQAILRFRQIEK